MSDTASLHSPVATLAGATLVVTRPAGDARPLARRAASLSAEAIALPGLALRPITGTAASIRGMRFDDWIFTSPSAVRFGATCVTRMRKRDRTFGLGSGTQRALARRDVEAIVPRERSDSEGLLALPELAAMRGRRVAIVGAPGGRDLIAPTLRRRGAEVEAINVYRREPPRLTRRHLDALASARDPLVTLVSSGEALSNLVAQLPTAAIERLRANRVVVSSARLAALAREHGFSTIVIARSPAPDDLIAAAVSALAVSL